MTPFLSTIILHLSPLGAVLSEAELRAFVFSSLCCLPCTVCTFLDTVLFLILSVLFLMSFPLLTCLFLPQSVSITRVFCGCEVSLFSVSNEIAWNMHHKNMWVSQNSLTLNLEEIQQDHGLSLRLRNQRDEGKKKKDEMSMRSQVVVRGSPSVRFPFGFLPFSSSS